MNPSTSPPVPMQHRLAVDWTLLVITVLADPDLPPAKRDRLKVASLRLTTEILRDVSTPTSSNMDAWFEDWCAFLVAAGKNGNQPQVDEAIANVTKAVLRLAQSPVSAPPTSEMSDSDIFSALAFGPQQSTPALQLHQADQSAARAHSANTINPSDLTVAMCAPFYFQDPTLFSSPGLYVAPSTAAVGKRKLSELEASGSPISHRPQERTVLGNISNQSQPQQPETRPDQTPRANLERTSQPPKNNPAAKIVVDLIAEEGSFLANQIYRILSGRGSKKMSCQEEQDKADEIGRYVEADRSDLKCHPSVAKAYVMLKDISRFVHLGCRHVRSKGEKWSTYIYLPDPDNPYYKETVDGTLPGLDWDFEQDEFQVEVPSSQLLF